MALTTNDVRQSVLRSRRFGKRALAYAAAATVATTATAANADFVDQFDPLNWTVASVNGNPDQSVTNDGMTAILTGTNFGTGDALTYTVTVASSGPINFDWSYTNLGGDYGSFDYAGFLVNGAFTLLADNQNAIDAGGTIFGSESIGLNAGDTFAFTVTSLDGNFGAGQLTVGNFSAIPEPSSALALLALGTIGGLLAGRRRQG